MHSKRVGKMRKCTRNVLGRCETTLETSWEDVKLHSKWVEKSQSCVLRPYFSRRFLTIIETNIVHETGKQIKHGTLQSYWNTTRLWNLTVVLEYYEAMEPYSRIGILRGYVNLQSYWKLRGYGNLQSYWTTAKLFKTHSRIVIPKLAVYEGPTWWAAPNWIPFENFWNIDSVTSPAQSYSLVASVVYIFFTRFECSFRSASPVSSVVLHLLHSFRV